MPMTRPYEHWPAACKRREMTLDWSCRMSSFVVAGAAGDGKLRAKERKLCQEGDSSDGVTAGISPQARTLHQVLKAGIAANGVRDRAHAEVDKVVVLFFKRSFEPLKSMVFVAQAGIDSGKVERGDVACF